jgi:hypothetical protein
MSGRRGGNLWGEFGECVLMGERKLEEIADMRIGRLCERNSWGSLGWGCGCVSLSIYFEVVVMKLM